MSVLVVCKEVHTIRSDMSFEAKRLEKIHNLRVRFIHSATPYFKVVCSEVHV